MNQTNELQGLCQSIKSNKSSYIFKKWEECSIEEKIEKLRDELKSARYINNRVYSLEFAINELNNHSHDENGQPTVKMDLYKNKKLGGQPSSSIDNLA